MIVNIRSYICIRNIPYRVLIYNFMRKTIHLQCISEHLIYVRFVSYSVLNLIYVQMLVNLAMLY